MAKYEAGDNTSGKPYIWPTWEDIVKRGVAKNYNNDEKYFNQQKAEAQADDIKFWKRKNIDWKKDSIKTAQQNIVKAQNKLDNLK